MADNEADGTVIASINLSLQCFLAITIGLGRNLSS